MFWWRQNYYPRYVYNVFYMHIFSAVSIWTFLKEISTTEQCWTELIAEYWNQSGFSAVWCWLWCFLSELLWVCVWRVCITVSSTPNGILWDSSVTCTVGRAPRQSCTWVSSQSTTHRTCNNITVHAECMLVSAAVNRECSEYSPLSICVWSWADCVFLLFKQYFILWTIAQSRWTLAGSVT